MKLLNMHVSEFLDKSDRSLAFAVFGAAQYNSFPVAVLPVSSDELLLCFDGLFTFLCLCCSENCCLEYCRDILLFILVNNRCSGDLAW